MAGLLVVTKTGKFLDFGMLLRLVILSQRTTLFSWPIPPMPYEEECDRQALKLYVRYNKTSKGIRLMNHRGVTKAYPLDYVIHHHILNDQFGQHIVALTICRRD